MWLVVALVAPGAPIRGGADPGGAPPTGLNPPAGTQVSSLSSRAYKSIRKTQEIRDMLLLRRLRCVIASGCVLDYGVDRLQDAGTKLLHKFAWRGVADA